MPLLLGVLVSGIGSIAIWERYVDDGGTASRGVSSISPNLVIGIAAGAGLIWYLSRRG